MAVLRPLRTLPIVGACLYACGIIVLVFYGRALEQTVRPLVPESHIALIFWSMVALPLTLWALAFAAMNSYRLLELLFWRVAPNSPLFRPSALCGALILLVTMLSVTVAMPINIAEFSHFPIYAGQAALIFWALKDRYDHRPLTRAALTLLLTNMVSLGDEVAQYFHPSRFFDLRDLTLNFVGSLWGLLLVHSPHRVLNSKARPERGTTNEQL